MMTASQTRIPPQLLWAQDRKSLFLTVNLLDAKDVKIDTTDKTVDFQAFAGQDYGFHLELYDKVKPEVSILFKSI